MSTEPGHSNAETHLTQEGKPDHRFKEVCSDFASYPSPTSVIPIGCISSPPHECISREDSELTL
jgi:hypothetical protein